MTHKEIIKITLTPYKSLVLQKAHDFAENYLDADTLPEELYNLLEELSNVTDKLMDMSTDN